jgi:hypothetical protein
MRGMNATNTPVKHSSPIRAGGLAAMAGGVLFLAGSFIYLVRKPFLYYLGFLAVAILLVTVGMVGFHVLQRHGYAGTGSAGFWSFGHLASPPGHQAGSGATGEAVASSPVLPYR